MKINHNEYLEFQQKFNPDHHIFKWKNRPQNLMCWSWFLKDKSLHNECVNYEVEYICLPFCRQITQRYIHSIRCTGALIIRNGEISPKSEKIESLLLIYNLVSRYIDIGDSKRLNSLWLFYSSGVLRIGGINV